MSFPIDLEKFNDNFKNHKNFYMDRTRTRHIPIPKKEKGDILKKLRDFVPLVFFQRYLQNIFFCLNNVIGSDRTMDATVGHYIMALNIDDLYTNVGYDYVTYIANQIYDEIVVAQEGRLENFRFDHYSLLMHLILYKNVGFIDQSFIESTY